MSIDKKYKKLQTLIYVSTLINSTLDSREIQNRTIKIISDLLDAEAGSFLLLDEATGELIFETATGEKGEMLTSIKLQKNEGIAGWVAHHDEPLIVHDVQSDDRFFKDADEMTGYVTKSIICVPVRSKGTIIGVLQGINKRDGDFSDDDLYCLRSLADQVAIAFENARLYADLKETFYSTIEALADVIELRDPLTGGHIKRVMTISLLIGRYLGLGKKELEDLKLAATLHDIGKVGIGDDVLLKGKSLDSRERGIIDRHPKLGSQVLKHITQLKNIIPGVRSHHERYDGEGYPDGLKQDEIPLIARIIAVADAFDAMTSERPYKKKLAVPQAVSEIEKQGGTQFDPLVVDAFLQAWKHERCHFEDKSSGSIRV